MYYETTEERAAFFNSLFQFRMERPLGEGAFGLAILAFDETESVQKVFKLPRDGNTTDALKTEGANLVRLRELLHKNIIQLYQFGRTKIIWNGEEQERYYLLLAYGGTSLRTKLGKLRTALDADGNPFWDGSGKILQLEETLQVTIDVCQGLEAAHGFKGGSVRIIHRDIKPENILIDDDSGLARITDFGISRVIDRSTGIVSSKGTPPYMAPEAFHGHASTHSDIFSLGVVVYEMLTGHLPFESILATLKRTARDPREFNEQIPSSFSSIILKSLAKDVEQRYQSASEMLGDLRRVQATLYPLPPHLVKVEQMDGRQLICDDKETHQRVTVRLCESQLSADVIIKEIARLRATGIEGINIPNFCFRREHMLGVIAPRIDGQSIAAAFGPARDVGVAKMEEICHSLSEVSRILGRLHDAGILHGCLSPNAIYIDKHGKVIIDGLGFALMIRDRKEIGNVVLRESFSDCLPYMSPSLIGGEAPLAAADDIFSVGAILFYLLTGRSYYGEGGIDRVLETRAFEHPVFLPRESNPLVTLRLQSILRKVLRRPESADSVYRDAKHLAEDLKACRWPEDSTDTLCDDALLKYESGDILCAYDILEKALFEDPGNPRIHYTRGVIYFREKEFKWAEPEFECALTVEPSQSGYLYLAKVLLELGDRVNKAVRAINHALDFGDGPEVRMLLAKIRHAQGRAEDAGMEIDRAVTLEPDPAKKLQYESLLRAWRGVNENNGSTR